MLDEVLEAMKDLDSFTMLDILDKLETISDEQLEAVFQFLSQFGLIEKVSSLRYILGLGVKPFLEKIKELE